MAGGLLAGFVTVAAGPPTRASAMEIDCSAIGGAGGLPAYVESYGVKCAGGGSGTVGGTSTGGSASSGCAPNVDKVPEGFFDAFGEGVDYAVSRTSYTGSTVITELRFYRTDLSGKKYLGGEIFVWNGPSGSGIHFINSMFSRIGSGGFLQSVYYDSSRSCSDGYGYELLETHAGVGTSPANPTPLVAPGITASGDGPVMARGTLTQMPASPDKYLLRVDVTNTNTTLATPVGVSLIVNEFDVESVVASSGGVDCTPAMSGIQECAIAEMASTTTQSFTLLLDAHADAPADAQIPIALSYLQVRTPRNGRQAAGMWFYTATRPGAVVVDPVPTPPSCAPLDTGTQIVVSGIRARVASVCHNGLPMAVTALHGSATIDSYGALTYTSDPSYRGAETLTVTASNSHGRVSDPVAIPLTVADPPHTESDAYRIIYETPFTATTGVTENDSIFGLGAATLPDGWYAQPGTTPPAHGRLDFDLHTGRFSYLPEPGFSGTDSFQYRLEGPDGAVSNPTTVTLTVVVP